MSSEKIVTPNFKVSFPQVFTPKSMADGGKEFYSIVMMFDLAEIAKDPIQQERWDKLVAAVDATALEKWGKLPASWRKPFKQGNEQRNKESGEIYQGFEGMVIVNAKSETKPGLLDVDHSPIMEMSNFYGGCYAIATLNCYAWSHPSSGKGVSFGLGNLMKRADGTPLGGGKSSAEDDFASIPAAKAAAGNDSALFS